MGRFAVCRHVLQRYGKLLPFGVAGGERQLSVADYGRTRRIEERTGVAGVDRNRVFGRSELFSLRDAVLFQSPGKVIGGSITFEGRDVLAFSKKEMASFRGSEVAMIFQNPMTCLNPVYTVGNQLIEALRAHDKKISKADAAKRAMEMLELVGINNVAKRMKQYPHEFSVLSL